MSLSDSYTFEMIYHPYLLCGRLPSTCPSQIQDPLANQGRHTTHLGSLRLNQDKLCLTPEVKSFPSSIMSDIMDKPSRLDLSDKQINPIKSSGFLVCVVNHA